eukprot:TRINITY_DN12760_c0_g1_i9.p5 TRINITY_DN12760_c0_g1~~TRINITY_DN12760_c0_g1_i9.p5  ORF type:complete len:143 (+),score=28.82 TRINITY_DN12760_c0_g1_i9:65-493(+)
MCIRDSRYDPPVELGSSTQERDFLSPGKDASASKKKSSLPPFEKQNIDEILNAMFPPKILEFNGKTYVQSVSTQDTSRKELLDLEEKLLKGLKERQARKSGICPIREDLHNQLFDEIIRQVTINCPERGDAAIVIYYPQLQY